MDKEDVEYKYSGTLFGPKKKKIGICNICNLQSIMLSEKFRKRRRLYDLSYTWHLKQTNK